MADERILGGSDFVQQMLQAAETPKRLWPRPRARAGFPGLLARIARTFGVAEAELAGGSRRAAAVQARAALSALAVGSLGLPGAEVARTLGVAPSAVSRGVAVGTALLAARGLDPAHLVAGLR